MDDSESAVDENEAIIVKADEVDEAGADISTISPTDSSESEFTDRIETRRAQDAQAGGSPKILANAVPSPSRPLSRPILRREGSAPAPPQQPPPPAPPQSKEEQNNATDSLSLLQLKRLVTDLPKIEPTAYAYDYIETRSFPEELQEWFQYSEQERHILLKAKHTFIRTWEQAHSERPESSDKALEWTDVEEEDRAWFMQCAIKALDSNLSASRIKSLECISYVALGAWGDTASMNGDIPESVAISDEDSKWIQSQKRNVGTQLTWMARGARILFENGAVRKLVKLLSHIWNSEHSTTVFDSHDSAIEDVEKSGAKQLELDHILTTLYVLVEVARWQTEKDVDHQWRNAVGSVKPSLLSLLTQMAAKLRWEDPAEPSIFSRQRLFLLLWKTSLLLFGSFTEVKTSKAVLRKEMDSADSEHDESFITASPLDYHLFRQEITSKYPAYSPPQPLIPIELENNSILPPLPSHPSRQSSQENIHGLVGSNPPTGSIFNQPVHIATPAPSPPPSPAGPGGKSGKKQNYQTNQNFPFLYPPPSNSKDIFENKGHVQHFQRVQDARWDDSDVPASILEAGSLFASRMRMSRSLQQLWDVREEFIQAERGWNEPVAEDEVASDQDSPDEEELERFYMTECRDSEQKKRDSQEAKHGVEAEAVKMPQIHDPYETERETDDEDVQRRLDDINHFYRDVLPDLQSLVIVLFKELFQNVQALIVQNGPNSAANGVSEDGGNDGPSKRSRTNPNSAISLNGLANGHLAEDEDGTAPAVEGLNEMRSREISSKAVSGILLVLLKWFKFSHIMKFEYLTQLLLDANFLPLVLKFFAHQDVDKAVEQRNDREDLDFFAFCHLNSKHPDSSATAPTTANSNPALEPALSSSPSSSEDEAAPPPITKHRRSPTDQSPPPTPPPVNRPEVDELGIPTSGTLPQTPLTSYAPRFFLTNINLLRLLQKITKRKAHRALLLVQYKSSTILRKALRIPQPSLRLYTLKLFKSQVPYCGRKWRQTNMRVITAIYLHCRPELRDEWLCGGDVDGVVEEALPLEQAGRGLVHWWHLRGYRDVMERNTCVGVGVGAAGDGGGKEGIERDEYNFFARELDKMGWGVGGVGMQGMVDEDEGVEGLLNAQAQADAGRSEFEGGVLQMEGWA